MEETARIIRFFISNESALESIGIDELRDVVGLASIVLGDSQFDVEMKRKAWNLLCDIVILDKLPVEERWTLYWQTGLYSFMETSYDNLSGLQERAYASIFQTVERKLPPELLEGGADVENSGPIVLVTNQFLNPDTHAPSRRILDYAYVLEVKMGVPVRIINEAGSHFHALPYVSGCRSYNFAEVFNDYENVLYRDRLFPFFQVGSFMPDLQEIANLLHNIKEWRPRLVLGVGGSCLTADLCWGFAKTASIPCNTAIPITMAEYPVVCRKLERGDHERLSRLYPWQHIKEATFNYIMPDDANLEKYSRTQFGIPDDAWLLVSAGNRMDKELSAEFLQAMDDVLEKDQKAMLLIVGRGSDVARDRLASGLRNADRIIFTGYLKDGSQAIRLGDVYVQPERKGGGRAAFEALHYGIPVITTAYGDAYYVCGDEFAVASYGEMAERIQEYERDEEAYEAARERAVSRAAVLEDMEGMLKKLLDDLGVPCNPGKEAVDPSRFYPIFEQSGGRDARQAVLSLRQDMEGRLSDIQNTAHIIERRLRDSEWATVFRDTLRGSEWLKDVSISPGRSAIGYPGLYALYRSLDEFRPRRILELGLGQSTRVIGSYAGHFGAAHTIVEHDGDWISFFLGKHGKNEGTRMVRLDCAETPYEGRYIRTQEPIRHYEGFAAALSGETFDFIFIDGPQGSSGYSRPDVTELLPECLEKSFVIMLDDSERQGEQNTMRVMMQILTGAGLRFAAGQYDGVKNTGVIVSEDLKFLLTL